MLSDGKGDLRPAPTRIGIVGVGKIARDQHVPAIARSDTFLLRATAGPAGAIAGIPNHATIEAMLEFMDALDAVAICTPPQAHYGAASLALSRGLHVLVEKPPCVSLAQLDGLARQAAKAGRTLYTAWHSRHARSVALAARLLRERKTRRVRVTWMEDVRQWHPGQAWIWQAGGFGVFDAGINALSILTEILPEPLFAQSARLHIPSNCDTPIAAEATFVTESGATIEAVFDFRHTGEQTWTIEIETDKGPMALSAGGGALTVDGNAVPHGPGALQGEYDSIYGAFASLIARGASDVDGRPLRLVADIFLIASRATTEPFEY